MLEVEGPSCQNMFLVLPSPGQCWCDLFEMPANMLRAVPSPGQCWGDLFEKPETKLPQQSLM